MQETICQAICAKRTLTVHQKTSTTTLVRVVEPYALYPTADGTLILESRLVAGDYGKTRPPHWCPIPLAEITVVRMRDEPFQVHLTYKPQHKKYARALCRV